MNLRKKIKTRKIKKYKKKNFKGGNSKKIFDFYDEHNYGDNILSLKFLYNISKDLKNNNIQINYYYNPLTIKNKDELERYIDPEIVKLHALNEHTNKNNMIQLRSGKHFPLSPSIIREEHHGFYYSNLVKFLGLEKSSINTELFQKEPYLLELYEKFDSKFKDVDILLINSIPNTVKFESIGSDFNIEKINNLGIELSKKYKVVCTNKINDTIPCTLTDNLKLQDIGAISTHAKYIIAVDTGPIVPCYNEYAKKHVKKWFFITSLTAKFSGIDYMEINSLDKLNSIPSIIDQNI